MYSNQISAFSQLKTYADADRHVILIDGMHGVGKTYMANQYAELLNIPDFCVVPSVLSDVKQMIQSCTTASNRIVVCVENIDMAHTSVASVLLKFIEDIVSNVYVVVTCVNRCNIPSTVLSRCFCTTVGLPTSADLDQFMKAHHIVLSSEQKILYKCVKSYSDIQQIVSMPLDKLSYFKELPEVLYAKIPISTKVYKLGHYSDKSSIPINLVFQYILCYTNPSNQIISCINACVQDMIKYNVPPYISLLKLCLEVELHG